ncbi:hypothetical protein ACVIWV_001858 [Bradyrhizobium diazoefficiens]
MVISSAANCRRGAQHAEPDRAGLEDIAGIDRQQRGDAAEQHREQVERDGAEDRRIAPDEANTGEDVVGVRALLGDRLRARPDETGQDHPENPEQQHHGIGKMRRDRVGKTAERGTRDGRDLPRTARDGRCPLERALRRDQRQQRRGGRAFEGAGNAEHEGRDEDLHFADCAEIGDDCEIERGRGLHELAELDHALALEAVGGVAGDEHEQRGGQELHEADHAEVEGRAGEVVDLPADRDRRDLAGKARQAAREQEEQEGAVGEEHAGADRRIFGYWLLWHRLLGHPRTARPLDVDMPPRD